MAEAPRYQPDRLLWGAVGAGVAPGVGLLVTLTCAWFATRASRRLILGIAALDLLLACALGGVLLFGPPIASAGLVPVSILGVAMSEVPAEDGVRLVEVVPGLAAAAAGLSAGDVVLSVDGVHVARAPDVSDVVENTPPGTAITLRVKDDEGRARSVQATLGARFVPSVRSTTFHVIGRSVVLGFAFLATILVGAWGLLFSRPRWAGAVLACLGAGGAIQAFLMRQGSHEIVTWLYVGAVIVFAGALWWRMKSAEPPPIARVDRTSRGFVLGLVAAGAWGVRATLAVYLVSVFADVTPAAASNPVMAVSEEGTSSLSQLLIAATLVFVAPFFEELLFRGALLSWLAARLGPWSALAVTSLIFGALHVPTHGLHFLVATAYGAALGWTWLRTGSLVPCVFIHVAINFAATVRFLL